MTVFENSDQLYGCLKVLFSRIKEKYPSATRPVQEARMVIRLRCTSPSAEVVISGRTSPIQFTYGPSSLLPDLDVVLTADALHRILLAELPLRKALGSGQMKVRGPVWKTPALEEILHQGQALYPGIVRELGVNGYRSSAKNTLSE